MGDGENTGYRHVLLQEPFSLLFLLLLLLLLSLLFKTFLIHHILIATGGTVLKTMWKKEKILDIQACILKSVWLMEKII